VNASAAQERFDIAVIGGGLVGLTFVKLLAEYADQLPAAPRIALVEAKPPVSEPSAIDQLRVSAVAPAVQTLLTHTNVWQSLEPEQFCRYERMHVWHADETETAGDRLHSIEFTAAELGVAELGHIVNNHAMRTAAWSGVAALPAVELITANAPQSLAQVDGGWVVTLANGEKLETRLLLGADGIHSWVRDALGLVSDTLAHEQHAIVAEIATEHAHDFTARQRFLKGGPIALLPLMNGNSSLVWSCADAQAESLLDLDATRFSDQLSQATNQVLGRLECVSDRLSFPLASAHAPNYTGRRFALLGDVAHQVHPLAGQGLNLGLLDAAVLAENLATHLRLRAADPGDRRVLRRYERSRKGDNLLTEKVLVGLNRLFNGELASAAGAGLDLLDRSAPMKRLLARYAMRQLPTAGHSAPRN
jgi:2-octaprenylphenol hydroxylase